VPSSNEQSRKRLPSSSSAILSTKQRIINLDGPETKFVNLLPASIIKYDSPGLGTTFAKTIKVEEDDNTQAIPIKVEGADESATECRVSSKIEEDNLTVMENPALLEEVVRRSKRGSQKTRTMNGKQEKGSQRS
jgi:hypothetical protein